MRFYLGDFPAAERMMREAETLDPYAVALPLIRAELYYYWRRYDDSIALTRKVEKLDGSNWVAIALLARDLLAEGRAREALDAAHEAARLDRGMGTMSILAPCLKAAGQPGAADRLVSAALAASPPDSYNLALMFARMGDKERTLEWLPRAVAARTPDVPSYRWDPVLDPERGDARFEAAMRRVFTGSPHTAAMQ